MSAVGRPPCELKSRLGVLDHLSIEHVGRCPDRQQAWRLHLAPGGAPSDLRTTITLAPAPGDGRVARAHRQPRQVPPQRHPGKVATAQVSPAVFNSVICNVGTLTSLRIGASDATTFAALLGGVDSRDLVDMPNYRAFVIMLAEGTWPWWPETVSPVPVDIVESGDNSKNI